MKEAHENEWKNPNQLVGAMRCTSVKHAKDFMEKGQIKFSTPRDWEQYAIKGRGDVYEGTKAFASMYDLEHILELDAKYPDTERITYKDRTLFKYSRSMGLPCLCMYGLNIGSFTTPTKEGKRRVETKIPAAYFDDFVDHKSKAEIDAMKEEDKPAIFIINNFQEFRKYLVDKLVSIGCKKNEIEISCIRYCDYEKYGKNGWMEFTCPQPNELFIKSDRFANQNELRIVINTDNKAVMDILKQPIELGNMEEIAVLSEKYYEEGIRVEMTIDAKL